MNLTSIPILFHQRSDFDMVDNPSIAVFALLMCMLTSLSVDEILLQTYMNWFTNFRGMPFNEVLTSS